jgi:transcriptional regulator with XRE-family HTH domain
MPSQKIESLADYVRRVRSEKRYSLPEVERRSGGLISNAYVSRIENGQAVNPTPEKLKALAKGLGVSEEEIFNVARGKRVPTPTLNDEIRALFFDEESMTPQEKDFAMTHLRMIRRELEEQRRQRG